MGNYLTKGTTFADGGPCNAALLNAHVDDAIIKATAISSQALKDPASLSDEILVNDGGVLKKETLQQLHDLILYPGSVVQVQYGDYVANTGLPADIPGDDTIPQITEGTEIVTVTITPRFATSNILLTFQGWGQSTTDDYIIAALFKNAVSSALAATAAYGTGVTLFGVSPLNITHLDSPASVSAQTYRIRVGSGASNMRLNGLTTGRLFGGVGKATLLAQEIKG